MKALISPEGLEIANKYLETGSIAKSAESLGITTEMVHKHLSNEHTQRYINAIYLDAGYRNRTKLGALLDKVIESKLEEAEESGVYTNKDLVDLLTLAHKFRMDELKSQQDAIKNQTNIQINEAPFGQGNYGALMEKLLAHNSSNE